MVRGLGTASLGRFLGSLGIGSRGWQVSDSVKQVWLSRRGWAIMKVAIDVGIKVATG